MRLDRFLTEAKMVPSKSKAQSLIEAGYVLVNGQVCMKSAKTVSPADAIKIIGSIHPWVSRGGMKLAHAMQHFKLSAAHQIALDVGASTGGFTDVLLTYGAEKVYAVDVGEKQLHPRLQLDKRVISLEKTNAKALSPALIHDALDWVVCDASFISLTKVLPAAMALTKPEAQLVALIKPQFEVGKDNIGKDGVVWESRLHEAVCEEIQGWIQAQQGWKVAGICDSPILGPKGNKEFLLYATKAV